MSFDESKRSDVFVTYDLNANLIEIRNYIQSWIQDLCVYDVDAHCALMNSLELDY